MKFNIEKYKIKWLSDLSAGYYPPIKGSHWPVDHRANGL
jgi:hypothetical protein